MMASSDNGKTSANTRTMEARYQRAASWLQGMFNNKLVQNDILFPHWLGQSECFWYERQLKKGKQYRLVNGKTKTNEVAFDHETLAQALAAAAGQDVTADHLPITNVDIALSPLRVTFDALNKRWVFEAENTACRNIPLIPEHWVLSPNGKQAVFTRDYNLWVHDLASGKERALTDDGRKAFAYAIEGEAYGESTDPWGRRAQVSWSPDGKRIFTLRRDTREVKDFPLVHHMPADGSLRPTVVNDKIALPRDIAVPVYQLLAIEVTSGAIQHAHYPGIPVMNNGKGYFNDGMGWWAKDSRRAYFVDQSRSYQTIRVVEFDPLTGNTRVLLTENSETHLNLAPGAYDHPVLLPLPETNELIWWSERTGWGHLYLYDLDTGELKRTITEGEWLVREIVQFDPERRELFVQTAGRVEHRDPYYRDLCRVHLDSGELTTMVSSDHDYFVASMREDLVIIAKMLGGDIETVAGVSSSGNFAVVTRTRVNEGSVTVLVDRHGKELLDIETADISALPTAWQWPEPVKLKAADGETDIYGIVCRPSDFSPQRSYPVVACGYYMPELPIVPKGSFNSDSHCATFFNAMALAELGFIVVSIDSRGTPCRDKAFQDTSYGQVFSACTMEDEIAGIRQLAARYSYMDLERVGVICPGGGPGAVRGLLEYPDFYKVGVSMVQHDGRLMACTMLGDKYEEASAPTADHQYPEDLAGNLKGKLLLMHGMLNKANSVAGLFRIVEALQRANKDFDMLLLPRNSHGSSDYTQRRAWDYLVKHLLGVEPPREFNLATSADLDKVMGGNGNGFCAINE